MGFFTASQIAKTKVEIDPDQLRPACKKCGLSNLDYVNTPKMAVSGEGKKKILIVGEFSTKEEDSLGTPFSGDVGFYLNKLIRKFNLSLNRDFWKVNAVRCRPSGGEFGVPTHAQIQCCLPSLEKTIYDLKPITIIACGPIAITALFGKNFSNRTMNRWRMYCIPDENYKCNVIPLHHPKVILENEKDLNSRKQFERDINSIGEVLLKRKFIPREDYESKVKILTDFEKIKSLLERIIEKKPIIAYDYETTGLKPYKKGHKIVTIGIATSVDKGYAFPFNYKSFWTPDEFQVLFKLWRKILRSKKIKKISHNNKFESIWSMELMRAKPACHFDTMMGCHVLDNRAVSTGLKFQTFVNFGVRPYDDSIKPFLKSKDGEFNTIEKAPLKDLLVYNGLDCIFTYMLYKKVIPKIVRNKGLLKAYNFFIRGLSVMADIQDNGTNVNTKYYEKLDGKLEKKVSKFHKYLTNGREAKAFERKYKRPIKITSNKDLGKLFYTVLGKDPVYTAKNQYKTDKTTMESLNLQFVETLLDMKKYEKARGTYVAQFLREIVHGKIHPFFDLHIPVSYRSSSSKPNWQNIPKRDPEIGNMLRKGVVPTKRKNAIIEADFGGAEVITSASYHKDPTFMYDVQHGDMHRDLATDLWMLPKDMLITDNYKDKKLKKLAKMIRFFAKNNWTFAQFYGDYFGSCAKMLWENVIDGKLMLPNGQSVEQWINDKGIYELGEINNGKPSPGSFMEHCKNIEKRMWTKRFPKYTQWKKDTVIFYREYGFIENHFGFRFSGYMSVNQCCNFPIQSASFHLLVYTLIIFNKWLKKNRQYKVTICGQIHDSIIMDCPHKHIKTVLNKLNSIVVDLQNVFKWLPIPMEMEYEISEIKAEGGNFSDMTEYTIQQVNELY